MSHVILLVDDHASNALVLQQMLAGSPYACVLARDGQQALDILARKTVSVVLLDVHMPGMDGFEVARRIRATDRTADVPIILITASEKDEAAIRNGYEAGAIDFLVKPVDREILRHKVQLLCTLVEKERRIQTQLADAEIRNRKLEAMIREHVQLEEARMESEMRYRSLIALSPIPVLVQVQGAIVYLNPSALQLLGLRGDEEIAGRSFSEFVIEADRPMVQAKLGEIETRGGRSDPISCRLPHGRHVELNIGCILYDDQIGVQMAIQDVTAHKKLAHELTRLSQIDGLTGIANRRKFDESAAQEWKRASRTAQPLSVLMIDLDNFKRFNDCYGHLAGDDCLKQVARVLDTTANRSEDIVARYGGEEFILVLPNTPVEGALGVAEALVEAVRALDIPHDENRPAGRVTISCGLATARPADKRDTLDALIKLADDALYHSKRSGGNTFHAATPVPAPDDAGR